MLVRVYQTLEGVRVFQPNADSRLDDEDDAAFLTRTAVQAETTDPALAGVPFVDVERADLPDRATRAAWRIQDGALVVDQALVTASAQAEAERTDAVTTLQGTAAAIIRRMDAIKDDPTQTDSAAKIRAIVQDDVAPAIKKIARYLATQAG